ncbi:hypothetical protein [Neisseria sicca]|uniref:hypothetical protein n=1 Tax=Neisseria sicca TaxID=490 RepID=UPI0011BD0340|nr:hypothetical protein [Neisseria sicca]
MKCLSKGRLKNLTRWFFRRPFDQFGIVNPHRKYLFSYSRLRGDGKPGGSGLRQSLSTSEKPKAGFPPARE